MPDYSLGRAHGKIEIDYDGSGADKAARDLDRATASSDKLDTSLGKTNERLRDSKGRFASATEETEKFGTGLDDVRDSTERFRDSIDDTNKSLGETRREYTSTADAARGYRARLREVEEASRGIAEAEKNHSRALLDEKSTIKDIEDAERDLANARKRHEHALSNSRAAYRRLRNDRDIDIAGLRRTVDNLHNLRSAMAETDETTHGLSESVHVAAVALGFLGPQGRGAALGLERVASIIGITGDSASRSSGHIRNFVRNIANFEMQFGKISGLTLALPSLGGLAGLGGAAALQGVVGIAGAVRQLSGALALLPAAISGAALSMSTLKITFHGVGDALKDMMADDPKAFLEDLKNMAPIAGRAMLQIAQFRNMFKLAGATIQDSFFSKIINDITPLIQTWLPALTKGMSAIADVMGQGAHAFAGFLQQPQMMAQFQAFVNNLAAGMQAMQPAMLSVAKIFTNLTVVGSRFFTQIGQRMSMMFDFFNNVISKAAASGSLQRWIQSGVDAISHLINIVYSVGAAFNHIMDIADRFGGGGLLGWIDKLAAQLNAWTQSTAGQKALTDFFALLRQATDAFMPMLKPLLGGLMALGQAFTELGVAIAPGWQTFFDTFSQTMTQLEPSITGIAPALNQFLTGLASSFAQLMARLGPQLPQMFQMLSNAFTALLPQLPQLLQMFLDLAKQVGPQLPKLFQTVTTAVEELLPRLPIIIGLVRDFVSVLTGLIDVSGKVAQALTAPFQWLNDHGYQIKESLKGMWDSVSGFFADLPHKAADWGRSILSGLAQGMANSVGLGAIGRAAKNVVDGIASWFQRSPAKQGPFSGDGYTMVRGRKMITDMAAGMTAAQSHVAAAAKSTMTAAAAAFTGAPAAGGSDSHGGALLPDHIASADTSVLDAWLNHQFDDKRGLKGLASDLGNGLQAMQSGFQFLNTYVAQLGFQMAQLAQTGFGRNVPAWRKTVTDAQLAAQAAQKAQRDSIEQGPSWTDTLGTGPLGIPVAGGAALPTQTPLALTASSSKQAIQQAIIAAGRQRGLSDGAITTALAVAAAESGFNSQADGGIQGSAGWVGGLYQQSPTSGWGTREQVLDPNHAINAFYNAYAQRLATNPDALIAAVLTQNPQLGGGAANSDYAAAVRAQMNLAQQIMTAYGKRSLSWNDFTGSQIPQMGLPTPPTPVAGPSEGIPLTPTITPRAGPTLPNTVAVAQPFGATTPTGMQIADNPNSRATSISPTPNVEAGIKAAGGLPTLYPTSGNEAYTVPAWAQDLAKTFGLTASTYSNGGSLHQMGYAFDFNGPMEGREALARFISQNLAQQTLQLIYRGSRDYGIVSGRPADSVSPGYFAGDMPGHADHVHWATDVPPIMLGQGGTVIPPLGVNYGAGIQSPGAGNFGGYPISVIDDANKSVDEKLLDAYLRGNPALAQQIGAAQTPGATDDTVKTALTNISSNIEQLKADPYGNKNSIDALTHVQNQIAQQRGFTQQQGGSMLSTMQGMAGSAANVVTSIFQAVSSGLDALGGTQDIADRLVYGVRNTEDVNTLIDDVQKYIVFAADIANSAGNIMAAVGSIVDAVGAPAAGFGASTPGEAISAAGTIAQLTAGVLQGVNAAIDFGQQVYHWTTGYLGKYLSSLVAFGNGDLMGNVRFLLDRNAGQLISYSTDNPLDKKSGAVPDWMRSWYDPASEAISRPGVGQLNIYAGPGQTTAQMMNDSMWLINTGGTGAGAAANF